MSIGNFRLGRKPLPPMPFHLVSIRTPFRRCAGVPAEIRLRAATSTTGSKAPIVPRSLRDGVSAVFGTGFAPSGASSRNSLLSSVAGGRGNSVPPAGAGAEPQLCNRLPARRACRPVRAPQSHWTHRAHPPTRRPRTLRRPPPQPCRRKVCRTSAWPAGPPRSSLRRPPSPCASRSSRRAPISACRAA